jgi:sugar lactone lactonase YvrE
MLRRMANHRMRLLLALALVAGLSTFVATLHSAKSDASSTIAPATTGTMVTLAGVAGVENDVYTCVSGIATQSDLYLPAAVAVYDGAVYFADEGDNCVYKEVGGTISVVAGTGDAGYNGDNRPANTAQLSDPQGLAFDAQGDLFIADSQNERIREVTPNGVISTVAGNGIDGYSGDGGPATSAELNLPLSVAVDSVGDLYIADTQNEVVREVSTSGTISTIAGNGTLGYNGDEIPATSAELHTPSAVALGPNGAVYIGDVGNNRVRMVLDGMITTVAGDSEPGGYNASVTVATQTPLDNPYSLAVDSAGDIFIADSSNCVIREVVPSGTISTIVGIAPTTPNKTCGPGKDVDGLSGPTTELYRPYGMALDAQGNIYIADTFNDVVRELVVSTGDGVKAGGNSTTTSTTTLHSSPTTTSTTRGPSTTSTSVGSSS